MPTPVPLGHRKAHHRVSISGVPGSSCTAPKTFFEARGSEKVGMRRLLSGSVLHRAGVASVLCAYTPAFGGRRVGWFAPLCPCAVACGGSRVVWQERMRIVACTHIY